MAKINFKEFRKKKNLNQDELAQIIGMTQSNLSRIETNGLDLTGEQLDMLISHFGKEEVDKYIINKPYDEILNIPYKDKDEYSHDFIDIIKRQNDTICRQIDTQNQYMSRIIQMNEHLITLLEKIPLK